MRRAMWSELHVSPDFIDRHQEMCHSWPLLDPSKTGVQTHRAWSSDPSNVFSGHVRMKYVHFGLKLNVSNPKGLPYLLMSHMMRQERLTHRAVKLLHEGVNVGCSGFVPCITLNKQQ